MFLKLLHTQAVVLVANELQSMPLTLAALERSRILVATGFQLENVFHPPGASPVKREKSEKIFFIQLKYAT
jgi:hypothetical protein